MKNKQVQFFYFSGTKNTFLVVNKMREVLEELGAEVELLRLEEFSPADVDLAKTIGGLSSCHFIHLPPGLEFHRKPSSGPGNRNFHGGYFRRIFRRNCGTNS